MGNYYLYKLAEFMTNHLPLPVCYAMATFLSDCQYFLSKADRKAVESNLRIILNTDQVPVSEVRNVFRNFGKYLADFFTMTRRINKEFIKNSVQVTGIEHLNEALSRGKGAIIVSAHIGNWEMGGAVLGSLGYPLSVVALSHKDERVNDFFNKRREFFGASVIQTNVALRRCLEHLKKNRLLAILADRDFGHHGLKMDFLGRKSMIPQGAAQFSLKTGAPIIPGFFIRGPKDQFIVTLAEPIYPPSADVQGKPQDTEDLIKKYLYLIEEYIKRYPSQWLIFRHFETL